MKWGVTHDGKKPMMVVDSSGTIWNTCFDSTSRKIFYHDRENSNMVSKVDAEFHPENRLGLEVEDFTRQNALLSMSNLQKSTKITTLEFEIVSLRSNEKSQMSKTNQTAKTNRDLYSKNGHLTFQNQQLTSENQQLMYENQRLREKSRLQEDASNV